MTRMLGRADSRSVAARNGRSAGAAAALVWPRAEAAAVAPRSPPKARREGSEDMRLLSEVERWNCERVERRTGGTRKRWNGEGCADGGGVRERARRAGPPP